MQENSDGGVCWARLCWWNTGVVLSPLFSPLSFLLSLLSLLSPCQELNCYFRSLTAQHLFSLERAFNKLGKILPPDSSICRLDECLPISHTSHSQSSAAERGWGCKPQSVSFITDNELCSPCSSCPAGTCDGCTFYFVWESAEACPLCTEQDYHEIEGACKKGFQVQDPCLQVKWAHLGITWNLVEIWCAHQQ